jgi:hypothetical protein
MLFFHHGNLAPKLRGAESGCNAARAPAHDNHIVVLVHIVLTP